MDQHCEYCGITIKTAIFKNSGHCSDLCRKALAGEITEDQWYTARGITKGG